LLFLSSLGTQGRGLLNCRHKFDLRTYVLVARTDPLLCFYHDGYALLQSRRYSPPRPRTEPPPAATCGPSTREHVVWSFDQVCISAHFLAMQIALTWRSDCLVYLRVSLNLLHTDIHLSANASIIPLLRLLALYGMSLCWRRYETT